MHKKIYILFLSLLITLLFLLLTWDANFNHFSTLTRLNNVIYDHSLKMFHPQKTSDTIVIVDIDEESLKMEGKWAWPRSKLATLLDIIRHDGAAVIALDILFPENDLNPAQIVLNSAKQNKNAPREALNYLEHNISTFDNDTIFAESLAKGDIVLGVFFNNEPTAPIGVLNPPLMRIEDSNQLLIPQMSRFTSSIPSLAAAAKNSGFTTTIPDTDGTIRSTPLLIQYHKAIYPALALEAARLYLLAQNVFPDLVTIYGIEMVQGITLGDTYIPTDPHGKILIPYVGPSFSFPYIAAYDVLHNRFAKHTFENKIVIIGSSASGISDLHSTPLQSIGYPGCEVHANVIETILSKHFLLSPIWIIGLERVLLLLIGFIFSVIALRISIFGLYILSIIGEAVVFSILTIFWTQWSLVLPHPVLLYLQILFLALLNFSYDYLFESRYRKRLHEVYGQYVSSAYIDQMLEKPTQYSLVGRSKPMSVLFADITGFTSIAEKLDAEGVKNFLNSLFTPLTAIIFEHKGTIDKYVGDMVMAFWNDPIDDPDHPEHAVETAIAMIAKVQAMASSYASQGITNVQISIGVNTGIMSVGDMGSQYRKAYTVLGDSVNLASRLQSANKFYKTHILVTETTKNACPNIIFRFIDRVCVKGKKESINIYQPICNTNTQPLSLESELEGYDKALQLYYNSDFIKAENELVKLIQKYPEISIYQIYLKRCKEFQATPPEVGWDGACVLQSK